MITSGNQMGFATFNPVASNYVQLVTNEVTKIRLPIKDAQMDFTIQPD